MAKMTAQLSEASGIDQTNNKFVFSIVPCLPLISRRSHEYVTEHLRIKSGDSRKYCPEFLSLDLLIKGHQFVRIVYVMYKIRSAVRV